MSKEYWTGYDKEPMGGSNPYKCCVGCGLTDPHINGDVTRHSKHCSQVQKYFQEYPTHKVWMIGSDQAGEYIVGHSNFLDAKNQEESTDHIRLIVSAQKPFI